MRNAAPRTLLVLLSCLVSTNWLSAQQFDVTAPELAVGTLRFRNLFYQNGCRPITKYEDFNNLKVTEYPNTVLVVLGDTSALRNLRPSLRYFVENGGAALIATDHKDQSQALANFGIWISGPSLEVGSRSKGYHEQKDCPFVKAEPGSEALFQAERANADQKDLKVATNRPGAIQLLNVDKKQGEGQEDPLKVEIVARFAAQSHYYAEDYARAGPYYFAASYGPDPSTGRVLFLSDHSVFINGMLWYDDIDNLDFANNCVHWLITRSRGSRTRILFIDEGGIQKQFALPSAKPKVSMPPPDALVYMIDLGLEELQKGNSINNFLRGGVSFLEEEADRAVRDNLGPLELFHEPDKSKIPRSDLAMPIVFLSLVGFFVGIYLISNARFRPESRLNVATPSGNGAPKGSFLSERGQALALSGNYMSVARELSRELFAPLRSEGSLPAEFTIAFGAGPDFKLGRHYRRLIRDAWRLSTGTGPAFWSRSQWQDLLGIQDQIRDGIARGAIRSTPLTGARQWFRAKNSAKPGDNSRDS